MPNLHSREKRLLQFSWRLLYSLIYYLIYYFFLFELDEHPFNLQKLPINEQHTKKRAKKGRALENGWLRHTTYQVVCSLSRSRGVMGRRWKSRRWRSRRGMGRIRRWKKRRITSHKYVTGIIAQTNMKAPRSETCWGSSLVFRSLSIMPLLMKTLGLIRSRSIDQDLGWGLGTTVGFSLKEAIQFSTCKSIAWSEMIKIKIQIKYNFAILIETTNYNTPSGAFY